MRSRTGSALGANLANLLYQAVGLSALGFGLAPFIWGTRLITTKRLDKWKWRLPVLVLAVLLISVAVHGLFDNADSGQRGGLTGRLGVDAALSLLGEITLPSWLSARQCVGIVAAGLGTALYIWAAALSRRQWAGLSVLPRLVRTLTQPWPRLCAAGLQQKQMLLKHNPNHRRKRPKLLKKSDRNLC